MSLSLPTRTINDAFTEAETSRSRARQRGLYERDVPDSVSAVLKEAGQYWWLKPSVFADLVEAGATREDWQAIGEVAGTLASSYAQLSEMTKARDLARRRSDEPGGIGGFFHDAVDVAKGVSRVGMSALESGYQEVQGGFRALTRGLAGASELASEGSNARVLSRGESTPQPFERTSPGRVANAFRDIEGEGYVGSQSTFGIMLGKLVDGEISVSEVFEGSDKALGHGYFTGGDIRVEQAERAYRSAHIGDQSLTMGRLAAYTVSEPGTRAYNIMSGLIDAGAIIGLDPANLGLGVIGKGVKAGRYFDAEPVIPLLSGSRRSISENVGRWLDSRHGGQFMQKLAGESDPVKILDWSKGEFPIDTAVRLADADDVDAVRPILEDVLGLTVNRKPKAGIAGWHHTDAGLWIRHRAGQSRLFANMPRAGLLDRTDPEAFVTQMRDQLINAHVERSKVDEFTAKAMRAATSGVPGSPLASEQFDVMTVVKDAVRESLKANGLSVESSRRLTRLWEHWDAMRAFNIDSMTGLERPLPDATVVAGQAVPSPQPQVLEQFLSRTVPMPDAQVYREIRARTSHLADWVSHLGETGRKGFTGYVQTTLAADEIMRKWKPIQFLRGAYILRVVGDEQARMASAGLSSFFSHPLSYLSVAMADDGRLAKLLDNVPGATTGRMSVDLLGKPLSALDETSDFADALYKSMGEVLGVQPRTTKVGGFIPINVDELGYVDSWADGLKFLHDNPVANRLAKGEPLADVQQWFWDSSYRNAILGSRSQGEVAQLARQVEFRAGADRYVAETMRTWIDDVTQNQPELLEYVATGRINDAALHSRRIKPRHGGTTIHRNFEMSKEGRAFLQSFVEQGEGFRPNKVIGSPRIEVATSKGNQMFDHAIDYLFDHIATRPSNWASRAPTFKQHLWKRAEALLPDATPEAKEALLNVARREAKLSRKQIARLEAITTRSGKKSVVVPFRKSADRLIADADRAQMPASYREIYEQWEFDGHIYELTDNGTQAAQVSPRWTISRLDDDGRALADAHFDLTPKGIEVHQVYVEPAFRGQGYSSELSRALDDFAGSEELDLYRTTVVNRTHEAHLQRAGYQPVPADFVPEARTRYSDVDAPSYVKKFGGGPQVGTDGLSIDDLNTLASHFAAKETKKLLYDLANRGQAFDVLRLVFPFGEAWKEVTTTWFRLLSEKPKSIRTFQRTVEGARGAGFFQVDPQTGQEVYVVPGSAHLVEALTGVEGDMVGSVSGLSIAGSVIPGVGPAVQFAAGTFLPDKPQFDFIRDAIFQFGGEGQGIVDMLTPSWADKLYRASRSPESDRAFNSDVGYMLNALSASGDYDLSNRDDLVRMQADAVDKARRLVILRGITQFWAPSAPSNRVFVENASGQALLTRALAEELRKFQNEDYDTALERFVNKYGTEALQAAIPLSETKDGIFGLGASKQFGDFERENKNLFAKFPEVAGMFAPEDIGDDFSSTVYDRQFRDGRRRVKSQNDRVAERNHTLARLIYTQQKSLLPDKPNQAQKDWLQTVRDDLVAKYPGYEPEAFNSEEVPTGIRQLEQAIKESKLDDNPVAKASRFYFEQRARAIEAAGKLSTLQRGKAAAHLRDWLNQIAEGIKEKTPEFARVWDSLLSRELVEDVVAEENQ